MGALFQNSTLDQPNDRRPPGHRGQRRRSTAYPHDCSQRGSFRRGGSRSHGARSTPAPASSASPALLGTAPRLPDKPSIAVLPFTNMSGDPEQEYFSDGITEDIITALSRLHWFFVIARNSTFVYKGQAADVKQVGRDLGVRYVLEGSVRKSGQRVRITSQLLDATTGNHIWSERYDRDLTDIFALQDEITASVTAAIEPKLLAAEGLRAETRSTEDLDAWDLVARALSHFWKLTAAESANGHRHLAAGGAAPPGLRPGAQHAGFRTSCLSLRRMDTGRQPTGSLPRNLRIARSNSTTAILGRTWRSAISPLPAARPMRPSVISRPPSISIRTSQPPPALSGLLWSSMDSRRTPCSHFEQAMRMSPRDPFNSFFFVGIAAAHYLGGSLFRGNQVGATGRAAAAWISRRAPHPVRQPGAGRANRGRKRGDEHASAIAAGPFDRSDQAVGALHHRADGALSGGYAEGGTERVRDHERHRLDKDGHKPSI